MVGWRGPQMAAVTAVVESADVFIVLSMSGQMGRTLFEREREVKGGAGDATQLVACLPSTQEVPGLIPGTAELSRVVPACSES